MCKGSEQRTVLIRKEVWTVSEICNWEGMEMEMEMKMEIGRGQ